LPPVPSISLIHPLTHHPTAMPFPTYPLFPQPLTNISYTILDTLQSSTLNPTLLVSTAHPSLHFNTRILLLYSGPQYFSYLSFSLSFASFHSLSSECSPFYAVCFNHFLLICNLFNNAVHSS
jgi:hypothetical protein